MATEARDRCGLGWRPDYATALLAHLDRVEVVEVLIEPALRARPDELAALAELCRTVPTHLHGVSLGLASTEPTDVRRLEAVARLATKLRPDGWSEHLAFVRAGGREIGHLAAPPRAAAVLEGLARNVAAARRVVGTAPALENVASLVEPPGSELPESAWLPAALDATGAELLLDLHNLHANALNFGFDPLAVLDALPWDRVGRVHVAGGRWIEGAGARRWLDDHRHAEPDAVLGLLEETGLRAPRGLAVVLEQDADFPPFADLLVRLDAARAALARGRVRRAAGEAPAKRGLSARPGLSHAAARTAPPRLDALAALYADEATRSRFFADPAVEGPRMGLGAGPFDLAGVALAARSFAGKRARQ